MAEIILHQWQVSPFCGKVRKILRLKGLPYRIENYNGLRATKAVQLSAAGKLPVPDVDGKRIPDSRAIAAYLDRRQPEPALYPPDPGDVAMARTFEDWAGESLYYYEMYFRAEYPAARSAAVAHLCADRPHWEQLIFAPLFSRTLRSKLKAHGFASRSKEDIEASFLGYMDDLDAMLQGRDWLVGGAQSIADIAVSAQIDEIVRMSHLAGRIGGLPRLSKWLARLAE